VSVDGKLLKDVKQYRVESPLFILNGPEKAEDEVFPGIAGKRRMVSDGYWIMLKPLPPGAHVIRFKGEMPEAKFSLDVTYELTVVEEKKKDQPVLECRVIVAERFTRDGFANEFARMEVEVKNVSNKPFDIAFTRAPEILQYMKREDRNPDGRIATGNCTDSLAPFSAKPIIRTWPPGQTLKAHFGSIGAGGPGVYQVKAIFAYRDVRVVSPVVEIELKVPKKE